MKYLAIYTPDAKTAGIPPTKEHMMTMGKFVEESFKSGVLLATGGLLPASRGGARLQSSEGGITVIDGPYTESKELIAGFAILQVKSKEEAIAMTKCFLEVAGDGLNELRQIMEPEGNPANL